MIMKKHTCRKCGIKISEHNQFLHDGMCDDCFFETYFPEDVEILETNPKKLPMLCDKYEAENQIFYRFIKEDKLNQRRFSNIVQEVIKRIDCSICANCCKQLSPDIISEDINRISTYLGLKETEFTKKYLMKTVDNVYTFKKKPCVFLHQNKCRIYKLRPIDCRNYPHLQKDVSKRTIQFFGNAEICPIVYNVLENSKIIFCDDIFGFSKNIQDIM